MIKHITIILLSLFVISSCTKRRLKDEREILIGRWQWSHTLKVTHLSSGNSVYDTIFPSDVLDSYDVVFLKKGNVIFKTNNVETHSYKSYFNKFQITGSLAECFVNDGSVYDFEIYLNKDSEKIMNGCVRNDSLMFFQNDFPFVNEYDENCGLCTIVHLNTFTRVK